MEFEKKRSHFLAKLQEAQKIVSVDALFPKRVLKKHISVAGFCESDIVFAEGFLSIMKRLLSYQEEDSFSLLVLDPDPEKYFFSNFKLFPLLEISAETSETEFFEALDKDPGQSPVDAIRYNSNRIVIFSDSLEWAIYCDRSYEVGILGAKSKAVADNLKVAFDGQMYSHNEVITEIFPLVFGDSLGASELEEIIGQFSEQYNV